MDIISLEQKAIDYARRGDFGVDAKQLNEELTKLAPTNQGAWTRLARCNLELGLLDDASAALEAALQINPQNTIARSLLQEAIRRQVRLAPPEPRVKRSATPRSRAKGSSGGAVARAFGRPQFAALAQLPAASAVESLGPQVEALLMALSDRPFAAKVVDARNRAGRSGGKLFRRNSIYPGAAGHVYSFHHGGRWEPQLNIGFFAAPPWPRSAYRAGVGFNLTEVADDPEERDVDQERVVGYFERFQQLVASAWKQLLTDWMTANGGFIQYGDNAPAVDLLPKDAVAWLANPSAAEQGWIFVGRWLFADRPEHAEILEDATQLAKWTEQTFVDLLPLWMSIYREK